MPRTHTAPTPAPTAGPGSLPRILGPGDPLPDPLPEAQQWTDATGYRRPPAKVKAALKVIRQAASLSQSRREIYGTTDDYHESIVSALCSTEVVSPRALVAYHSIGHAFDWRLDRDNLDAIAVHCAALLRRSADVLELIDHRETPEARAQRFAQAEAERAAADAERAEAEAEAEAVDPEAYAIATARGAAQCALLRQAYKVRGWSSRAISVRNDSYSMGSTMHVSIKDPAVVLDFAEVDRLANAGQFVRYDEASGEILSGGNRYVEVSYASEAESALAAPLVESCAAAVAELFAQGPDEHGRTWVDVVDGWAACWDGAGRYHIAVTGPEGRDGLTIRTGSSVDRGRQGATDDRTAEWLAGRIGTAMHRHGMHPFQVAAPATAPIADPAPVTAPAPTAGGFAIEHHTHTKKGRAMVVVTSARRTDRATWRARTDEAARRGGWYGRAYRPAKFPGGWCWWADEGGTASARGFLAWLGTPPEGPDGCPQGTCPPEPCGTCTGSTWDRGTAPAPSTAPARVDTATVSRIRSMADRLDERANAKLAPRLENTPKRQREAGAAKVEGAKMQRAAAMLTAWADGAEAGTLPANLARPPTKGEAMAAAAKPIERGTGYYDAPCEATDPGAWVNRTPRHVALRALLGEASHAEAEKQAKANAQARALAELRRCDIPGFYPTPDALADRMAELGELEPGDIVGDLGAGIGSLLLAALRAQPALAGCQGYEIAPRLAAYCADHVERGGSPWVTVTAYDGLQAARGDQSGAHADVVLINPPYEKLQHLDHVRAAYDWAKRRVVALIPAQVQGWAERAHTPTQRKAREWVEWLDSVGGCVEWHKVDPNAFNGADAFRQAKVATVILVINKD